ncbi:UNVERIFIED_ORG: hypothetical protein RHOFW104R5_41855 [Rhodanobacter sp. FW104-R5]
MLGAAGCTGTAMVCRPVTSSMGEAQDGLLPVDWAWSVGVTAPMNTAAQATPAVAMRPKGFAMCIVGRSC